MLPFNHLYFSGFFLQTCIILNFHGLPFETQLKMLTLLFLNQLQGFGRISYKKEPERKVIMALISLIFEWPKLPGKKGKSIPDICQFWYTTTRFRL